MRRPARNRLSPWIERLILSYDDQRQKEADEARGGSSSSSSSSSSSDFLKAHVIGVGQLTPSQIQGSDGGPTELLFLSDGVLQIPAVLTASAWEHLQEHEDRETFSSLVHATVCIREYRMQFHMAPEMTKSRFFLSIGQLNTMSVGLLKEGTYCCTTLPSVRWKIVDTWRALLRLDDSQRSQEVLELSELLGEWHNECLQEVLEDVRDRLMTPRPSTSAHSSPPLPATSWDVDRVRYKGERCFSVPVKCLLIPEEDPQQPEANSGNISATTQPPSPSLPSPPPLPPPDAERQTASPAQDAIIADIVCAESQNSPLPVEDSELHLDVLAEMIERPLSNPWDIFTPPCISSSSSSAYSSPETTPLRVDAKPDPLATFFTSTQLPVDASKESSFLPPYQKPPSSLDHSVSTTTSSPDQRCTPTTQQNLTEEQRDAKRKRSSEEEEEISRNPPSWIMDSGTSGSEVGSSPDQPPVQRMTLSSHSDGVPFSYSYRVSGQNLQDFGRFRVAESLLRWAVKYLVAPEPTDNHPNVI